MTFAVPRRSPRRPTSRRRPRRASGPSSRGARPRGRLATRAVRRGRARLHLDANREGAMAATDEALTPWVADRTVGEVLRTTATRHPDRDALVFPALGVRWSWRELDRRV